MPETCMLRDQESIVCSLTGTRLTIFKSGEALTTDANLPSPYF